MYSTCLFCHGSLGTNEAVEHFPVGRRLAFDGAKGRLWVVCGACERWNLTPLEERWEAIEECERLFRATPLRVSTDQIGLARVKEGLELVRIGAPIRPEMAAWRYGDQFGRRRRKFAITAALTGAGLVAAAPIALNATAVSPLLLVLPLYASMMALMLRARFGPQLRGGAVIPSPHGSLYVGGMSEARFVRRGARWGLQLTYITTMAGYDPTATSRTISSPFDPRPIGEPFADVHGYRSTGGGFLIELERGDAIRALSILTPMVNRTGASPRRIDTAVHLLEEARDPVVFCDRAVAETLVPTNFATGEGSLSALSPEQRLALEMATNEDVERAVVEGELHDLEQRWKEAEEIAGIADALFTAPSVSRSLADLKRDARAAKSPAR